MTETVTADDRPKRRNGAVLVSGNMLAVHFGCSRQHVEQLTAEGVIERRADGKFDQDQSRLKYLAHLRSPERRSARSEAAAKHAEAKTQPLHIRIEEKQRKLVRREDVDALIGQIAGVTPTALSSLPARCAPRGDLATPRCIERVVFEVRTEMAKVCQQMADKHGEPPLDDDP
jgi:hypothetical protein